MRRLDNPALLAAARQDPVSFVVDDGLLVVDEVQRAPEIMLPLKARVDAERRPGQFLLTGSARLLGLRLLPDALVGRTETIELWPFSQGELTDGSDGFVDAAFADRPEFMSSGASSRADVIERALRGGFPEAVRRDATRRSRFFASYVGDLLDRDVVQLSDIHRRADLDRLLRLLASRMATPLNVESVASELGVPRATVERYIALFEEVFLIKRIPAWSTSGTRRATRARKLMFVDTGLAGHLIGASAARVARDARLAGQVVENFALGELARQLGWATEPVHLLHYRTRDGEEVDAVLEHNDGRVVGIEVKAAATVDADDFRHLHHLRSRVPERFHLGIVLYSGSDVLAFGDGMVAAPLDVLWTSAVPPSLS